MLPAVSYVLIYVVLAIFLGIGIYAGYKKTRTKSDYLSSLGTQNAVTLATNWFASSKNLYMKEKKKSVLEEKFEVAVNWVCIIRMQCIYTLYR